MILLVVIWLMLLDTFKKICYPKYPSLKQKPKIASQFLPTSSTELRPAEPSPASVRVLKRPSMQHQRPLGDLLTPQYRGTILVSAF